MTRRYAEVIGDPIAHSKSPLIHNFWLARLGLDAEYRACQVRAEELADYFEQRRNDAGWQGCNVTMPHKGSVLGQIDEINADAVLAAASNTIVAQNRRLKGYNTDIIGVAEPLAAMARPDYSDYVATYVQIIGAGGAARAALRGACLAGLGDFEFYNRTVEGAKAMADFAGLPEWFGQSIDLIGPIRNQEDDTDEQRYSMIVINATSMGMHGRNFVPIDLSRYYPDTIVFDMVYAPLHTELLGRARALGMRTIDGLEMLVGQAAAAFELFFNQPAPREHDAELRALLTV